MLGACGPRWICEGGAAQQRSAAGRAAPLCRHASNKFEGSSLPRRPQTLQQGHMQRSGSRKRAGASASGRSVKQRKAQPDALQRLPPVEG